MNGTELKINGNGGKTITSNGSNGITVGAGKTLVISDIGNYSGFSTGITNNGGTVEIKDTVFSGNTTDIDNQNGNLIFKQGTSSTGNEVSKITGNASATRPRPSFIPPRRW